MKFRDIIMIDFKGGIIMIYLKNFSLLEEVDESNMITFKMNIHNNLYPLKIFPEKGLSILSLNQLLFFMVVMVLVKLLF